MLNRRIVVCYYLTFYYHLTVLWILLFSVWTIFYLLWNICSEYFYSLSQYQKILTLFRRPEISHRFVVLVQVSHQSHIHFKSKTVERLLQINPSNMDNCGHTFWRASMNTAVNVGPAFFYLILLWLVITWYLTIKFTMAMMSWNYYLLGLCVADSVLRGENILF